jgi:tetratricopeptide (TPR) repeat protein
MIGSGNRERPAAVAAISIAALVAGCGGDTAGARAEHGGPSPLPGAATPTNAEPVTFSRDVAPIVFARCAGCHRPGEMAPFSLLGYEDVSSRAELVGAVTGRRFMPPWLPVAGHGSFAGDRSLSAEEIEIIRRWIEGGLVEGDPDDLPAIPEWTEGWQLGEPDLVLHMPEYRVRAEGPDVFRNFVIDVPIPSKRWVEALEFRPHNRRVVHHAVIQIDENGGSRRLQELDPGPGFEGMFAQATSHHPSGFFVGWTPGKVPRPPIEGAAWRLDPTTDLVLQLHLRPTGREEVLDASIGLHFAYKAPVLNPVLITLGSQAIDIPPAEDDYEIRDSYTLPVDVEVLGVYPHAHYLGHEMRVWADLPDAGREWLLRIDDWDFNWQDEYRYAEPVYLPRGTTLRMEYSYDNSESNPQNPNRPPRRVVYGPNSDDEMGDLLLQVLPRSQADLVVLDRHFGLKYRDYELAGLEHMIRLNPDHRVAHFNLGVKRAEEGRSEEAIQHYREALRIDPEFAEAHNNLGMILFRKGEKDAAIEAFRRAIELQPDFARAHYNLGASAHAAGRMEEAMTHYRRAVEADSSLAVAEEKMGDALRQRGRPEEAVKHYQRAVELEPTFARAQRSLGMTLANLGYIEAAIEHLRDAIDAAPRSPGPLITLAELLAAYPDESVRDPDEAVRLAERAAGLTEYRSAIALDALAFAYASAGRVDEAVSVAQRAYRLARSEGEMALAERIEGRLEAYRRRAAAGGTIP